MGDPRKSKKQFSRPIRPYDKDRILAEKDLIKKYGLRRKTEIYRAEAFLRNIKRQARIIIASKDKELEEKIIAKVVHLGLMKETEATIDGLLSLDINALFKRRLETVLVDLNLANTCLQARQFIVHGHVFVDGIKVTSPKYLVNVAKESMISFKPSSSLVSSFEFNPKSAKKLKNGENGAEGLENSSLSKELSKSAATDKDDAKPAAVDKPASEPVDKGDAKPTAVDKSADKPASEPVDKGDAKPAADKGDTNE